ncbi:hypothetical protein TRAPUB_3891 [Trametes pubescens]|uniref:Ubiquitin-like protease family profile domain-containing protein n=1 Tax=Trametes pubescens TaxID=154538 RepID=A0A1M2VCB8_TRAPU|nr:hypothetical protein TRAPUB_3891 [Trametes pubescens]
MVSPPPPLLKAYCLPPDLPVSVLLQWPHIALRPGSRKFSLPPSEWLCSEKPTVTEVPVNGLLLPSSSICWALEPLLQSNKNSEGICSVQHPTSERDYLPSWIIPVWKGADEMLRMQQFWRERLAWLDRTAKAESWTEDLLRTSKERVHSTPWSAGSLSLQRGMVSMAHLARLLLSDKWLDDEVLDCLGDVFRMDLETQAADTSLIATAHLRTCLTNPQSGVARYYEDKLVSGPLTRLFMPCNINNIHWIPVEVDTAQDTISLGDSKPGISQAHIPALLRELRGWLDRVLPGRTWTINMTALETGLQQDSSSCGIATINAIERRIRPGATKWSPHAPGKARARYFSRCVEAGKQRDSESSDSAANTTALSIKAEVDTLFMLVSSEFGAAPTAVAAHTDESGDGAHTTIQPNSEPCARTTTGTQQRKPAALLFSDLLKSDSDTSESEAELSEPSESDDNGEDLGSLLRSLKDRRSVTKPLFATSKISVDVKTRKVDPESEPSWFKTTQFRKFRTKIKADDQRAEFSSHDCRVVHCSRCLKVVTMRTPNDTERWKEHHLSRKCRNAKGNQAFIKNFFQTQQSVKAAQLKAITSVACPGLGFLQDPRIPVYLARTAVESGGAPRREVLKLDILQDHTRSRSRNKLSPKQIHTHVLVQERAQAKWLNHPTNGVVTSVKCQKRGRVSSSGEVIPCSECNKLTHFKIFLNALRKPTPAPGRAKFTPKAFRNPVTGETYLRHCDVQELMEMDKSKFPWKVLAKRGLQGRYNDRQAFIGMLDTVTIMRAEDRLSKGKKLTNIRYDATYDEVCTTMALLSPRAYATLRAEFGGRGVRSMRKIRARNGQFKSGIEDANFDAAEQWAHALGWDGPFILATDDTKVVAALRSFHDGEQWRLGGVHGSVPSFSSYEELMELGNVEQGELAEKTRAWLLVVPVPGVPPKLIATMPLKSSVSRAELRGWHDEVSSKLASRGLHTVSYNVDGVETERGLTHDLQQEAIAAGRSRTWTFKHPIAGRPLLQLTAPLLENGKPCIMSTDGKHAKKNGRGSVTSGARGIAIGRYLVHFGLLKQVAEGENSPLMKSDIVGVDKQDDRAAARLFSSAVIDYVSRILPDELGLTIYLFIIGEIVDAQQNRALEHSERIKMLWRGRFFLDGWRQHILDHPLYALHTHFISRELYDILSIFINAMLLLIVTHRDYFPDVPLLHWLNSTETCEHFFGCARKIQKDFNFVEWLLMIPKISILMAGELRNKLKGSQEKATAARFGYHHSYFDSRGVDLANLASFPSDDEIEKLINVAHTEAQSLLAIVGINMQALPIVDDKGFAAALAALSSDSIVDGLHEGPEESEDAPLAAHLERLLRGDKDQFLHGTSCLAKDEAMTNLGIHATATVIHDHLKLADVSAESLSQEAEDVNTYQAHIKDVLAAIKSELTERASREQKVSGAVLSSSRGMDKEQTTVPQDAPGAVPSCLDSDVSVPAVDGEPEPEEETHRGPGHDESLAQLLIPLAFGTARSFSFKTLVSERQRHETKEATSAVTYR